MCAQNTIEQVKKKNSTHMQLNYYYYNVIFIYLDVIVYGMVYVFWSVRRTLNYSLWVTFMYIKLRKRIFLRGLGIVDPLSFTSNIFKKNYEHFDYSLSVCRYSFELLNYITLNLFPLPPPPLTIQFDIHVRIPVPYIKWYVKKISKHLHPDYNDKTFIKDHHVNMRFLCCM